MKRNLETERIELPARPVRKFAAETSRDLLASQEQIEQWMGRTFPDGSRLHQARAVLDDVATTGKFTPEQRGDDDGLRAIQLSLDIAAIAGALPPNRVADLRKDLETCAAGLLSPTAPNLSALQVQSQLVVRSAFFRAGVEPSQPTHSTLGGRKKPDILVVNGLATYAVEVKRPTMSKNVLPRALDASEQLLNSGFPGGIVIDITDCLSHSNPESTDQQILTHADAISDAIFIHGKGWKPGFRHVRMITVMARPTWQIAMTGTSEGQVLIHSTSCGVAFGTSPGTLDTIRSHWLRTALGTGLNRIGFTSAETEDR